MDQSCRRHFLPGTVEMVILPPSRRTPWPAELRKCHRWEDPQTPGVRDPPFFSVTDLKDNNSFTADSDIEKGFGGREDEGAGRLGSDRMSAAVVPPSMLPATSAPVGIIKQHGLWCRTRSFLFAALKWF